MRRRRASHDRCSRGDACCFPVGVCFDDTEGVPPSDCAAIGGLYQGDGSSCLDDCSFGDVDGGGTVDLRDFAAFQRCFGSKAGELAVECLRADVDRCGTLELFDFEAFFRTLTGP